MDKLVMVGLHTQPTSAVAEIDALVDVVAWAEKVSNNSLANTLHYLYLLLFLLAPFYRRGRVYKRKFCLSVCLWICPSSLFPSSNIQ